jgi:protein TonB
MGEANDNPKKDVEVRVFTPKDSPWFEKLDSTPEESSFRKKARKQGGKPKLLLMLALLFFGVLFILFVVVLQKEMQSPSLQQSSLSQFQPKPYRIKEPTKEIAKTPVASLNPSQKMSVPNKASDIEKESVLPTKKMLQTKTTLNPTPKPEESPNPIQGEIKPTKEIPGLNNSLKNSKKIPASTKISIQSAQEKNAQKFPVSRQTQKASLPKIHSSLQSSTTVAKKSKPQEQLLLPQNQSPIVPIPTPTSAQTQAPSKAPMPSPEPSSTPKSAPTPLEAKGPFVLSSCRPNYPETERNEGVEGTVRLRVLVGTKGEPLEIHVVKSSGNEDLDAAAIESVRECWKFAPLVVGGVPTPSYITFSIQFTLH